MSFPITEDSPIRHPGPPPAACDVVIIGGGVMGVMTAWFLAERGFAVTVCEKGRIAGEQSSRNWGWIRQQGRDLAELPIMVESLRIWKSLAQEMGEGLGFRQTGVTYLANTDRDMGDYADWLPHAIAHGLDTRVLSRAETEAAFGSSAGWKGALQTPSDARAEPWAAVPLLAQGAVARGVTIVEGCAVRGLDIAAGEVAGVVTEQGMIACDQVVVAAGAWSRLFLGAQGISIPQLSVLASVAATEPLPEFHAGGACDDHFAFRRRADGGYSLAPADAHDFFPGPDAIRSFGVYLPVLKRDIWKTRFRAKAPGGYPDAWSTPRVWDASGPSPFETTRILNPAPNMQALGRVLDLFAKALPSIGRPRLRSTWAGMIDTMPDVVPVIDHAPIPGLIIAVGLSGHGFGIGPGMGRVVADLVAGNPVGHDLGRFRFSRFSDGSKIAPGPNL